MAELPELIASTAPCPKRVSPELASLPLGWGGCRQACPHRVSLGQEVPAYPREAKEREAWPWAKGEGPFHSRRLFGEAAQGSQGRVIAELPHSPSLRGCPTWSSSGLPTTTPDPLHASFHSLTLSVSLGE